MLWMLPALAHAACTFDATPERLRAALEEAEQAYVSLDVSEFQRAMTEVDFMVPCLVQPVDPEVAVRLHRIRGLGQFIDGDAQGATTSLLAARRLAPDYVFPESVLPKGFELRDLYEGLTPDPDAVVRMPRPSGGTLVVDGHHTRERPTESASLVQVFVEGEAHLSSYLPPEAPLPEYPGVHKARNALLWSAAATSVGSAVLYGSAWSARSRLDEATNNDELLARQANTNLLVGGSSALAVGAAVQIGLALWSERRR